MSVRFIQLARRELMRAAAFYDRRVPGLGDRLLESVGRSIADIRAFPNAHSAVDAIHRRCLIRVFPYALIYRQEPDAIWIIALANTSRRPGYWRRRKLER